jgi:hypothetical protein
VSRLSLFLAAHAIPLPEAHSHANNGVDLQLDPAGASPMVKGRFDQK